MKIFRKIRLWLLICLSTTYYWLRLADIKILFYIYQRSANFIYKHFGINFLMLSNIAYIVSVLSSIIRGCLWVSRPSLHAAIIMIIYLPLYIANQLTARRARVGYINPQVLEGAGYRIFIVLMGPLLSVLYSRSTLSVQFFFWVDYLMYISAFYWLACTPLPPRKSTVRKLLEKLALSPTPELAGQES